MSFFDDIIQKIFTNQKPDKPLELLETIKRTSKEEIQYNKWAQSNEARSALVKISEAIELKRLGEKNVKPQIIISESNFANALSIIFNNKDDEAISRLLMDYFKEVVLSINYRMQVSERKIKEFQNSVQVKEMYFLKPEINADDFNNPPIKQLYGNIIIERMLLNNLPQYLKIQSNIYSDRFYQQALPFNELLSFILKPNYECE
ncbi:MAG: hypothetical protein ACK4IK_08715 [Bacteroidia bacterium]